MKESFLLERYRYVLDQKKRLNEGTFKVAAFFQAVILIILGGQFRVFEVLQKKEISIKLAYVSSWSLFWAAVAVAAVSVLLIVGGIASWFDYRNEEVNIEESLTGVRGRPPSITGFLRWYETYIIVIIIITCIAYWITLESIIIPEILA